LHPIRRKHNVALLPAPGKNVIRHLDRKVRFTGEKILPFLVIHPQELLKFPMVNIGSALFPVGVESSLFFPF
jgi:hypothetical protein